MFIHKTEAVPKQKRDYLLDFHTQKTGNTISKNLFHPYGVEAE